MAHYNIGYDDIIYYALYLKECRTNNPKISYDKIENYVKKIKVDLDSYNVDYTIMKGESEFTDLSIEPSIVERAKKIKLVKDSGRGLYSLNIQDSEALQVRLNSTIPYYIRSFFEPKGYAEVLGLNEQDNQPER